MDITKSVRDRILELCQEKGYTINGVAESAGINQSTVRNFLDNRNDTIGIITLKIICDGLSISITDFFNQARFKGAMLDYDNA